MHLHWKKHGVHDKFPSCTKLFIFVHHNPLNFTVMENSEKKMAILSAISDELDMWLAKESTISDGYTYESEFIDTTRKINQILLSKSLGTVSGNKNKKNFRPVLVGSK